MKTVFELSSALASGALSVSAFVVTHIASAAATVSWILTEWWHRGRPTVLGAASGCVAGLVAITPASGFVAPLSAVAIGLGAGALCYAAVNVKSRLGYDDSLDAVGVHGVGGIWGALATGLFASKAVNPAGADGLFYGNARQLLVQAEATVITMVFSFVASLILLKVIDGVVGLRVSEQEERIGLDLTQHKESGYTTIE